MMAGCPSAIAPFVKALTETGCVPRLGLNNVGAYPLRKGPAPGIPLGGAPIPVFDKGE